MKAAVFCSALAIVAFVEPTSAASYHGAANDCKNKPLVISEEIQSSIEPQNLLAGAQALQDIAFATPQRNRMMGTVGHNNTIRLQEFRHLMHLGAKWSLAVDETTVESGVFEYSPSGNISAPVIVVKNRGCRTADYPKGANGKIALISRGLCDFGTKSALAARAGALGVLIYNDESGGPVNGTLSVPPHRDGSYVPTLGLSQERGLFYVNASTSGAMIIANMNVLTDVRNVSTNNIIATTKCGNHDTILLVGAHSDSVKAGPGINDDGSGVIGILEVAKHLAKYQVNNAVAFAFWSGEELGLLGSNFFVETASPETRNSIRAYLNFDMIASPNYIHAIYDGDGSAFNHTGPTGSSEIEAFFEDYFAAAGQNYTVTAFNGRSDYYAFIEAGIPAGGTFTGAEEIKTQEEAQRFGGTAGEPLDANYHQAGDTVDNLNMDAFVLHTKAITAAVSSYAVSFQSLPATIERRNLGFMKSYTAHKLSGKHCGKHTTM
ncbi:hypothetical protein NM208_g1261 [Fusarium decemcellulare]|uniref:Uncharacterized protein n=1 Tax=Fusarium decemcellulare TaxID=57161 RepID=A0ACC1SWW7_9HYPO|nr:hypothetical protein NM208_g1261 [Fusarium decemcellulare]